MLTVYKCIDCGYMFKGDSREWDGGSCPSSIHLGRLVPAILGILDGEVEVPLSQGKLERWLASE